MSEATNPAVSVIIPVYNLEAYVAVAIASVAAQSFSDFEALVIDDGSTDGSLAAIRRAADGDARFRIIATPNRGVARARERALAEARGRYLCFLDGDDWWEPDMLERLVAEIDRNGGCDILCSNYIRVGRGYRSVMREEERGDMQGFDFLVRIMSYRISTALTGKLYRRELFGEGICHYPMRRGQDSLVNMQIACRAPRVRMIDYAGYNYLQRPGSEIHSRMDFDYCRQYADAVADIFRRHADGLSGVPVELLMTANALWWYLGYINRSSNPWRGDEEFVQRLRPRVNGFRRELRQFFSPGELLLFDLDRWRALRGVSILLLTLRRWRTSIARRLGA